jgi:hypothetical protein
VAYIALDTGSQSTWAGIVDSPTSSASDWTVNDPGFEPQLFGLFINENTAIDTNQSGLTWGWYVADSDGRGTSRQLLSEDGVSTSNATNIRSITSLRAYDSSSATLLHDMVDPSFSSNGWEFAAADISTADSTVRKWPAFAVEVEATTGGDVTFAATADGTSGISAAMALDLGLGATADGISGASAALSLGISFSGTSAGVAAASASLSRDLGVSATVAGSSGVTGDLSLAGDVTLSGVAAAVSGATGKLVPGAFRTYEVTMNYPTRAITVTAKGFGVLAPSGSITVTFDDSQSEFAFRQAVAAFTRYLHRELMKTRNISLLPTSGSTKE